MKKSYFKPITMGVGALVLFIGTAGLSYAEDEHHDQDANHQKQDQRQAEQPRQIQEQQDQRQKEQQAQGQQDQRQKEQQAQGQRDQQQRQAEEQKAQQKALQKSVWQDHRAQSWKTEHRTWKQRGGYNGYRVPQKNFSVFFGRNHGFSIHTLNYKMYGGYPSFEYNGFWFSVVDPWPEYWSGNWYENDDVYIDYTGGGYYLYNRRYPRDRIAVNFYLN
jgi:uncharacterized protein YxeA